MVACLNARERQPMMQVSVQTRIFNILEMPSGFNKRRNICKTYLLSDRLILCPWWQIRLQEAYRDAVSQRLRGPNNKNKSMTDFYINSSQANKSAETRKRNQTKAEMMLCTMLAQNNLSFSTARLLTSAFTEMFPDTTIAAGMSIILPSHIL